MMLFGLDAAHWTALRAFRKKRPSGLVPLVKPHAMDDLCKAITGLPFHEARRLRAAALMGA